jgi:hypothetical protein
LNSSFHILGRSAGGTGCTCRQLFLTKSTSTIPAEVDRQIDQVRDEIYSQSTSGKSESALKVSPWFVVTCVLMCTVPPPPAFIRGWQSSSIGILTLDKRQHLVISLLAGMMRFRSNIASIQYMLNDQDAIKSVSPSLFIDGSLELIASFASTHSKTRQPLLCLCSICLLVGITLVSLIGRDFSERL